MNDPSEKMTRAQAVTAALLDRSRVLEKAAIIAQLNMAKDLEESTFEEVIVTIQRDEPLAERLIFLANSAWFGGNVKVDKVDEAFARLGTADFYKASIAASLRLHLGNADESDPWWQGSETVAHVCEMTAQLLKPELIEAAFFAALFRDCAVPLMAKCLPDYAYLANDALGMSPDSVGIELECNETDHCTVGATIVKALQFPSSYSAVVQNHHARTLSGVESAEARELLAILLLGKRVETWGEKSVGEFYSDSAEGALLAEIAVAFQKTKGELDDVIGEMLRLYGLRRARGEG